MVLTILSVGVTTYGAGAFILGTCVGSLEWLQIGLLSMILGELIDVPKITNEDKK